MSALIFGDSPFARAVTDALSGVAFVDGTLPIARYDVVVHAASTDATSGTRALWEDIALVKRALEQARALHVPLVLCSKLSVVGARKGAIAEESPLISPFGTRVDKGIELSLDDEIEDLESAASWAQQRAQHADVVSAMSARVKRELLALGGASTGGAYLAALKRAIDLDSDTATTAAVALRAQGWGFLTGSGYAFRGYTLALAELIVARSDVAYAIVRLPEVLAHSDAYAASVDAGAVQHIMREALTGVVRFPVSPRARIETLPLHLVVDAVCCVTHALVKSQVTSVVHVATSARSPLLAERLLDLVDLSVRKHNSDAALPTRLLAIDKSATRSPASDAVVEVAVRAATSLMHAGIDALPRQRLPEVVRSAVVDGERALRSVLQPSAAERSACSSPPFFDDETRFSTRGLRACAVRAGLPPPVIDDVEWRALLLHETLPAIRSAHQQRGARSSRLPKPAFDSLAHLVVEAGEKNGVRPALSVFLPPVAAAASVCVDVSYRDLLARARAVALRLQHAGVRPGDRVVLAGQNHPAWGIVAFGCFLARSTIVPLDIALDADAVRNIIAKARPRLCVVDKSMRERMPTADAHVEAVTVLDLHLTAASGPGIASTEPLPRGDDVASILFTSGTTGTPKGVMLTHRNFCALLASLQTTFSTYDDDSMLSVLPLHHTFEFSCGLLMPLASGGRVYTPDALTGERVLAALAAGKITAIVGVPALWQLLERRITQQAHDRGDVSQAVFQLALKANRAFGRRTGMSFGKLVLKPVHDGLGGHLRVIISGGSALPPSAHQLFQGLGLPLAEGYGLTESAPVLTVAEGRMDLPAGTVGKAIPGVEIKLMETDPKTGVGEVWAKADNVMKGYFEDDAATRDAIVDGWLRTGDLGKIDDSGVLRLVGRNKDVVVSATGENIYLDDIEKKLEAIEHTSELTLLGIADPRGGERLAMVAVPSDLSPDGRALALVALKARVQKLPAYARPAVIELADEALPRTSTRKVKRKQLRATLELLLATRQSQTTDSASDTPMAVVRGAIAAVAGVDVKQIAAHSRMQQDLGFDSLMWVELQGTLEKTGVAIDAQRLAEQESVAAVEDYLRVCATTDTARAPATPQAVKRAPTTTWANRMLGLVKPAGRAAMTAIQREAYRTVFHSSVSGRAFIPHNVNTIVVANHTSHLDTGLVKFALGSYGKELRPLAAKDYFFEGNAMKVAFFEHFTNLVPIDRETGSGLAFEQAKAVVSAGHTTLIFPEGTRREDGTLGAFKPLVARLSLATGVDVLPVWMEGNFEALPRGSYVPNKNARELHAHIGPPLSAKEMARLTAHLPNVQAARAATELIRAAVLALSQGEMLQLAHVATLNDVGAGVRKKPTDAQRHAADVRTLLAVSKSMDVGAGDAHGGRS